MMMSEFLSVLEWMVNKELPADLIFSLSGFSI